ncbi:ABC transporter ATP-binding protein [Methanofervidicoccus abyssi]|uniref:Iron complex transport system ATP-binding protein n=1 Tax=Methanofervidicoccus abyssi TaxID=2082189 RepID=A0A401HQU5_9EURY|nr:ABC transporter ATP-binding protein [Methanofervidicoccus abyssi]GBF36572.1 iron complex transport system ATP-binding protein [Methanofervidicoccus abyssi]
MIEIKNLHFAYSGDRYILEDISFKVGRGELCGIFGPNGVGKSTLFKCIIGFLKPKIGKIYVDGRDITKMSIENIAKLIAYVPQEHRPPFPYLVKEIVLMGRTPHLGGIFGPKKIDMDKAIEAMEVVGISHLAERPYTELSGGQRQLVLLARALAQETGVMVLDEPTSALDFRNQLKIWNTLKRLTEDGISVVVSVHDPNHMLWFCDRVIVLHRGKIIANGKPYEVITEDVLNTLYGNICRIKELDSIKIVIPDIV